MTFRRIAITLTGIAAAAFLAAGPAAAATSDSGWFAGKEAARGGFSYENLGGPWGITRAHGGFEESGSLIGGIDISGTDY
ncbi:MULTISPECIES: hypothetical protein [unclassified Streptomyces]|uniref:hypothetical protein n=1 Tax=unclassified Streptomyces TaxID=2593676 RepID=UPI002E33EA0C|nr:hypothetical protein [Streptomyces sp. NBC_01477]